MILSERRSSNAAGRICRYTNIYIYIYGDHSSRFVHSLCFWFHVLFFWSSVWLCVCALRMSEFIHGSFCCSLSVTSPLVLSVPFTRVTRVSNSSRAILCFFFHLIFSNSYTLHLRVAREYFSLANFYH